MSYLNRVWMAASVAAVGHPDQGWKSGVKSLKHGKMRVFSGRDAAEIRPLAGSVGSDCVGVLGSCGSEEGERTQKMSYLNRVWMAASVAAVGHPDQGWKSGIKSLQHGKTRGFSGGCVAEIRPLAGSVGSDCFGVLGSCGSEKVARQNDESLRRVMYLNCWGQG
ncbi:unnamed protein product [Dovyalis caffra]|uniref:Uncharacterized protein n=1 Tax=Dovyalis caffra TaxID=77055 RepID=A0AAV1SEQ9_9ROSI|nr:unnamed protein product [Dovyalis caffra]